MEAVEHVLSLIHRDEIQKFFARFGIFPENAEHVAGHHIHVGVVNAPGGHAVMRCFDDNGHTSGLQDLLDGFCHLGGHCFLNL